MPTSLITWAKEFPIYKIYYFLSNSFYISYSFINRNTEWIIVSFMSLFIIYFNAKGTEQYASIINSANKIQIFRSIKNER